MTTVEYDVEVPMPDGVVLRCDVYRPSEEGPHPVLLVRTPYNKQDPTVLGVLDPLRATRAGFIVVIQDVRGRFASDGDWAPVVHERADGRTTAEWAARLPGGDGPVGTYGPSYLGQVQLANDSPAVGASVIAFTWADPADGLAARGGAAELGLVTNWSLRLALNYLSRNGAGDDAVGRALDRFDVDVPGARTTLDQTGMPLVDPTGPIFEPPSRPILVVAGWYDVFLQGCLDLYARTPGASLIIGPWSHNNHSGQVGDVVAGLDADEGRFDLFGRQLAFLRRPPDEPTAEVFITGVGRWRTYASWPPPSEPQPFRIAGSFEFDPADPVPTHGGGLLISPGFPPGPLDQARIERRPDVLVVTGEPLGDDLAVGGRVRATIRLTASQPSVDVVVRLCDVGPDGVSRNLTDGIFRVRDGRAEVEVEVDLWSVGHVFRAGHRIRAQITWSCFPRWDLAGGPGGTVTIHQGSAITLPIIAEAQLKVR